MSPHVERQPCAAAWPLEVDERYGTLRDTAVVPRALPTVAVAIACAVSLAACADHEPDTTSSDRTAGTSSARIDSDDRMAHGCAFVRGETQADASTRYYTNAAARALFQAALEDEPGRAEAAQLWDAADHLAVKDSTARRNALLQICTRAGFDDSGGMSDLRDYACAVASEIALERPDIDAYGPKSTRRMSGDPLRTDVKFVTVAYGLLASKESPAWLDGEGPLVALDSGDDARYRAALDHFNSMCTRATS